MAAAFESVAAEDTHDCNFFRGSDRVPMEAYVGTPSLPNMRAFSSVGRAGGS